MTIVDVSFGLQGNLIPVDHGYQLLSAISRLIPALHGDNEVGLHPIHGPLAGNRCQLVTERSHLTIRLPSDRIGEILTLAGKTLSIDDHKVRIGVPHTKALIPSARLYSRLVLIKGFVEPQPFLEAAQRQVDSMGIRAKPYLVEQSQIEQDNREKVQGSHSPFLRRTIRIRDKEIVGFALGVEELTAEQSVLLQEKGIGGRRRFGCGVFVPARR